MRQPRYLFQDFIKPIKHSEVAQSGSFWFAVNVCSIAFQKRHQLLGDASRSYSSPDWPGQNASFAGFVINMGQRICLARVLAVTSFVGYEPEGIRMLAGFNRSTKITPALSVCLYIDKSIGYRVWAASGG